MEKKLNGVEGYDTCHCLGAIYSFTAFMHIIYCCLLGGMRVYLNFLGKHVCLTYIAYHVYSVIDPSGTNIIGTR